MTSRTQITLDPETHKRARKRAAQLGVSFAEYVRGLVARDLADPPRSRDRSAVFNLGRSQGADIARHKDRMIAEAVAAQKG